MAKLCKYLWLIALVLTVYLDYWMCVHQFNIVLQLLSMLKFWCIHIHTKTINVRSKFCRHRNTNRSTKTNINMSINMKMKIKTKTYSWQEQKVVMFQFTQFCRRRLDGLLLLGGTSSLKPCPFCFLNLVRPQSSLHNMQSTTLQCQQAFFICQERRWFDHSSW